jgi:peptidoglycan hydrolase CwlO-like protein
MTTQELTKEVIDLKQATALNTESCERAHDRLDGVEKEQKEQGRLLVVIERLTNGISSLNEKVGNVEKKVDGLGTRITAIEQEPAAKWKQLSWAVLILIVGAVVGYTMGQVGLKP